MSRSPLFLGIDFGTSNSSIAYVYNDPRRADSQTVDVQTIQVPVDEEGITRSYRMPTLLSSQWDAKKSADPLLGWDVLRYFGKKKKNSPLLRRGQDLFESVKNDLGSFRVYPHAFSDRFNTPEKIAEAVFRTLVREAKSKLPHREFESSHVFITVPASLGAEARKQTREAAVKAGLREDRIELIDEPIAALLHLLNDSRSAGILEAGKLKNLLVFDYGGGTLDLCLVRCAYDPSAKSGLIAENLAISQ
jgi:molecular chaperone DnaK (HSP70)